jgi:hypothetical protein
MNEISIRLRSYEHGMYRVMGMKKMTIIGNVTFEV